MNGEERKRNGKSTFLKTNNSVPLDRGSHINVTRHLSLPRPLLFGFSRNRKRAAIRWTGWLGTQFLECCNWHRPLNRDRFAQGLDTLNLV